MTVLAFLMTLLQLILAAYGYFVSPDPKEMFFMVVYYGSPLYLLMNMFGADSVLMSGHPFYIGMFIFHAIKYTAFFRAQMYGDRGALFWLAGIFELTYLGLSGYYLN